MPPHETAYPSAETPKPHGDKLQHAVEQAAERKTAKQPIFEDFSRRCRNHISATQHSI